MRWGFEIYGLLTRWNPLNRARPFALPYIGKNVLVVGLGPGGLHAVAAPAQRTASAWWAIDGLKIEPLPADLLGADVWPPRAVERWEELASPLDQRRLVGVRRRRRVRHHRPLGQELPDGAAPERWRGGRPSACTAACASAARSTSTSAFAMGFDHIAIAAGAGKPTIIDIKNNLIRGVRKASDFLMALQLSGGVQARLARQPAGAAARAGDRRRADRHRHHDRGRGVLPGPGREVPGALGGAGRMRPAATLAASRPTTHEEPRSRASSSSTGAPCGPSARAPRPRARCPNFAPLVERVGRRLAGLSARHVKDSPAYRLNHEEITKFFEEGVRFIEKLSPARLRPRRARRARGRRVRAPRASATAAQGDGREGDAARAQPVRRRGHAAQHHLRARAPGHVRDRRRAEGLQALRGRARRGRRAAAGCRRAARSASSRLPPQRPHGQLLRRQPPRLRRLGRARDGLGQGRRAARRGAVRRRDCRASTRRAQPARDAAWTTFAGEARRRAARDGRARRAPDADNRRGHRARARRRAPLRARASSSACRTTRRSRRSSVDAARACRWRASRSRAPGSTRPKGLLSLIVLEMGGSSRLCTSLQPGEPVVVMGPTGHARPRCRRGESVVLCGGGLGNAVLFSIAQRAARAAAASVLYFAAYRQREDIYKVEEIEAATDQVIWSVDGGDAARRRAARRIAPSTATSCRPWAPSPRGELGETLVPLPDVPPHHRHRQRPHDGGGEGGAPRRAGARTSRPATSPSRRSTRPCSA